MNEDRRVVLVGATWTGEANIATKQLMRNRKRYIIHDK